jgi:hypothetical protein
MVPAGAPSPDRRVHRRFAASELRGLRTARVKYGDEISVIDLSTGGVLFETAGELKPDSTLVLEFSGPTGTVLIPSRVVRCQRLKTIDSSVRAEGACVFRRPLPIKDLVTGTVRQNTGDARQGTGAAAADTGAWQRVVGKYRDGRLIRGYTNDFSPSKSYMHISPTPLAEATQFVGLIELDALFFLRDPRATGMVDVDVVARDGVAPHGRKVAMVLPNGDELIGSTLSYRRDGSGFFLHPLDSHSAAVRVFVTPSGVRNIRFL